MSKFVLTAQLQLQAPTNTNQVLSQMRQQLSGVTVPVSVQGAAQAQKQIKQVADQTQRAATAAEAMGRSFGLATKRFAAFTIASRAVSLLTNSLANSIQESIDFQREMIKISQVSGKTMKQLKGLQATITSLSTSLGTSSTDLLKVTRILAQAGVQANDLETALAALAKTTLAATFDNIENTAEGAVAILRQFGEGVGALEGQLGAVNAVAGRFAVESGDLIGAVRRFGGVFKSAGGNLNELLAIFTSVRATTRESAESIATGLRTIFTRIQRPKTIGYLKQLGIELVDAEGKFVGPMEAARKLSEALSGLAEGDLRFVQIAEELGGFRQIGKVIPLLQQFETAQLAYNVARDGANSLDKDAATAQQALSVQITKVREEFQGLVRSLTDSASFQLFIRTSLALASALIKVGEALAPLLPLMATMGAMKMMGGMGGMMAGFGAGLKGKNHGGRVLGFARGGLVPGQGNRDTVPAMLSPGEFVIRQSSVQKMGASSLEAMNNNRFAGGGKIASESAVGIIAGKIISKSDKKRFDSFKQPVHLTNALNSITGAGSSPTAKTSIMEQLGFPRNSSLTPQQMQTIASASSSAKGVSSGKNYKVKVAGFDATEYEDFENALSTHVTPSISKAATEFGKKTVNKSANVAPGDYTLPKDVRGVMFEDIVRGLAAGKLVKSRANAPFDFEKGVSAGGSLFKEVKGLSYVDAKPGFDKSQIFGKGTAIGGKISNQLSEEIHDELSAVGITNLSQTLQTQLPQAGIGTKKAHGLGVKKKAAGGGIGGTDTVPALLTPGEFVINKKASQSIGYANLNRMNNKGVTGFATGGPVGVQKFAMGGMAGMAGMAAVSGGLQMALDKFGDKSAEASDTMFASTVIFEESIKALTKIVVGFMIFRKLGENMRKMGQSMSDWSKGKKGDGTSGGGVNTLVAGQVADTLKSASTIGDVKGATGGDSGVADLSTGTFNVGSAVINVQSQASGGGAGGAGDPGRPEVEMAGVDPNRGMVGDKAVDPLTGKRTGLKNAREERAGMGEEKAELQRRIASRKGHTSEGGSIAKRLEERQGREAQLKGSILDKGKNKFNKLETTKRKLQMAQGINPDTGNRKNANNANIQADPEKAAKLRAEIEAMENALTQAADATRDAQASFDLAGKEMQEMENSVKELDNQIDRSKKSTKDAVAARKKAILAAKEHALNLKKNNEATKKSWNPLKKWRKAMQSNSVKARQAAQASEKEAKEKMKSARAVKVTDKASRARRRALIKESLQAKKAAIISKSMAQSYKRLQHPIKTTINGLKRLAGAIKRTGKSAIGGAGRMMKKGAGVASGVGMAMTSAAAIGSAISSAVSQFAERDKERAIKDENVSGGAKAAGTAALAEGMGEMFTMGGYLEAVFDPRGFVDKRMARKESAEATTATDIASASTQRATESLNKEGSTRFKNADGSVNTQKFGAEIGVKAQEARGEIADLKQGSPERAKLEAQLDAQMRESIRTIGSKNITEAEAIKVAERLAPAGSELQKQYIALAKSTVAVRIAQQELVKANFDSLKMTSAFSGANAAVKVFVDGLTTGSSQLGGFIEQLKNAQGTIGVDATAAIDAGESALLGSVGGVGPGADSLRASISQQAGVARAANKFSQNVGGSVTEGSFSRDDAGKAKEQLREQLLKAIPTDADNATKKKMRSAIDARLAGITESGAGSVATLDISELLTGISEDVNQQAAGFTESMEALNKHNSVMTSLYKQREQLELKAAQALNKAIDIQLEAGKIFADFGGKALTTEQKTEARVAQFNNVGSMAGVELGGGGSADIRRVGEQLNNVVTSQNRAFQTDVMVRGAMGAQAGPGLFSGTQGVKDDKREEAKRANESLIQFTKQRITLLKEELAIVQKKNAAEKSSLEKLLSGDIEGFISGQAAAGAGAALRTGDAGLAGLFGSSALGAGFKSLEGQGLSDPEMQRAAGMSLGAVGINDTRSAQILAGSTNEEEAIKSEGRELASVMGDLAQQQAQFEVANIEIQDAVINAANATFGREIRDISTRNVTPLASGGMVYANRGMFVPRGTDTVPAMLTPGEFVVNRSAVQRSNNLQILRAMNTGGGASAHGAMSGGGVVRYYQDGGGVDSGGGSLASVIPSLQTVFSDFAATVDKLVNTKFQVALDPTNVNVNFNGASFLETMKQDIKSELLNEVGEQIKKAKPNTSGDLKTGNTVLGN